MVNMDLKSPLSSPGMKGNLKAKRKHKTKYPVCKYVHDKESLYFYLNKSSGCSFQMVWKFGQCHLSMQQGWLMLQEKHSDIALSVEVEFELLLLGRHGRRLCQFNLSGTGHLHCLLITTRLSHLVWSQLKKKDEYWQYRNVKCITRFMPMLSLWQSHKLHLAAHPKTVRLWDFFQAAASVRQTYIRQVTIGLGFFQISMQL